MPKHYSIEEMQKQIHQLQTTINLPGVPDDEKAIYNATIRRIQQEIKNRQPTPVTPQPTPPPPEQIKHTAPPSPTGGTKPGGTEPTTNNQQPTTSRHIHAGNQHPVHSQPMTATIQADHNTNPHNPTVTITWADGYTFTGDETAIRSRLVTTLRDTCALRLVQKGRLASMWRWSSPWRAAGFLQAIIAIRHNEVPTLRDLDVKRPSDLTTTVFAHITEKALIS